MSRRLLLVLLPFALALALPACADDDYGVTAPSTDFAVTVPDLASPPDLIPPPDMLGDLGHDLAPHD